MTIQKSSRLMHCVRSIKFGMKMCYVFKLRRFIRPIKHWQETKAWQRRQWCVNKLHEYLDHDDVLLDDVKYEEARQFAANNGWSYDLPVSYRRDAERRARLKELFGTLITVENVLESIRLLVNQSFRSCMFKEQYEAHCESVVAFAHSWFMDLIQAAYSDDETYALVKQLMTQETDEYKFVFESQGRRRALPQRVQLTVVGQMQMIGVETAGLYRAYYVLLGDKEPVVRQEDFVEYVFTQYAPGEFRRHVAELIVNDESWRLWEGQLALAQHDADERLQREAGHLCQQLQQVIVRRQAQLAVI